MATRLTDAALKRTRVKKGERVELWDSKVDGLHARVSVARGVRKVRWYLRYRVPGVQEGQTRRRRLKLGEYPAVPLADDGDTKGARTLAREALAELAAGVDPRQKREVALREAARARVEAEGATFEALAGDYLGAMRASERHVAETKRQLEKDVYPVIGDSPAGEVDAADVDAVLAAILDRGSETMANRTRSLLVSIFKWAQRHRRWQHLVGANPAEQTERPAKEHPRDRVLSDAEVKRLWLAAEPAEDGEVDLSAGVLSPIVSAAFRLRMLTGQRWTEISSARWEDVSTETVAVNGREVEAVLWTIPRERTKTERNAHVVPLSPQAVEVLEALRPLTEDTGWLFPGRRQGREREGGRVESHVARCSQSFRAWSKRAGMNGKDFIGKDLRRTVATGMARLGVDSDTVAAVLNHAPQTVTQRVYERYDRLSEKRSALAKWGRHVDRLVTGEGAEVVAIHGGKHA